MSDEENVPKFLVIARAVAAWPDTTSCEVRISCYEEPTKEDIDRCTTGIANTYEQGIGERPDRVAVVVVPYCASDEPEAPPYDPNEDLDADDGA